MNGFASEVREGCNCYKAGAIGAPSLRKEPLPTSFGGSVERVLEEQGAVEGI